MAVVRHAKLPISENGSFLSFSAGRFSQILPSLSVCSLWAYSGGLAVKIEALSSLAPNNSLDHSSGSVFRIERGAAKVE